MSGVDELLGRLESGGVLESQGTFTVDLREARNKLEKYRLATPHHYVLSLLSAAVASGAKRFLLEKSGGECRVGFDGRAYTVSEMKRLFENLVLGSLGSDQRLNSLGLAIHGARGLGPKLIEIESGLGADGVRIRLESQTVTIEPVRQVPGQITKTAISTHFRLERGFRSPWEVLKSGLGFAGQEESNLLKQRARYSTCDVYLGNRNLNHRRLGPWTLAGKLQGAPETPDFTLSSERFFPMIGDSVVSGYLGFAPGPGGWTVVDSGVSFQLSTEHSAYPTSRAVLYTQGLATDLSGEGLVRNGPFQLFAGGVDRQLDSLVLRTNADTRGLSANARDILEPLVKIAKSRRVSKR